MKSAVDTISFGKRHNPALQPEIVFNLFRRRGSLPFVLSRFILRSFGCFRYRCFVAAKRTRRVADRAIPLNPDPLQGRYALAGDGFEPARVAPWRRR